MITLKVDAQKPDIRAIRIAVGAIRREELVLFPTETVYGLAADATNDDAVKKIFEAKGRDSKEPLPIQIGSIDQIHEVASFVPNEAMLLANRFWPGPLTIVLPKNKNISEHVTGGRNTIGTRIPNNEVALAFLKELNTPIVATSANLSGEPPAKNAEQAIDALGNSVAVVLVSAGGDLGVASTVIDMSVVPPKILRHGTISANEIKEIIGEVQDIEE